MDTTQAAVHRWVEQQATRLETVDPHAPLTDLAPLRHRARRATTVAIGMSTRESHEFSLVAHRMLRMLVEELGFRALLLEGDEQASAELDAYVRTGTGDPARTLAAARPFYRTAEVLDVVRWMRSFNQAHPDDQVGFLLPHDPSPATNGMTNLGRIEPWLADSVVAWHERTGQKIAYWGGIAHTAGGGERTVPPGVTHRNAGSYLRERLGSGYLSVGLTFRQARLSRPVPVPPPEFAEAALDGVDRILLDLNPSTKPPEPVRAWLHAPARTRLVGPHYDPAEDAEHHLSGGSLAGWFDLLVHLGELTRARFLG